MVVWLLSFFQGFPVYLVLIQDLRRIYRTYISRKEAARETNDIDNYKNNN